MSKLGAKFKAACQHALMSWEMALEYIRTLIWPAVTLTLGFTFRRQLSSLFGRLQSLETPLGTAAFERQAAAVAQEAAEIENELADEVAAAETHKPEAVDVVEEPSTQNHGFSSVYRSPAEDTFAELLSLAQTQTTEAILAAWREVDKAIKQTASEKGMRRTSIQMIREERLLPDDLVRSVEDMRQLRNRVVHDGDVVLTPSGAHSYVTAAKRIVDALAMSRNPAVQAYQYEESVLRSLSLAGLTIGRTASQDEGVDAYANTAAGMTIAIEVLFRRDRKLGMQDIKRLTGNISMRTTNALVITNAPITEEVRDFHVRTSDERPRMEVVQWRGPEDDDALVRAISRLAA